MAGSEDGQQPRMIWCDKPMRSCDDFLLTCMRAGCQPNRARPDLTPKSRQLGPVEMQCRGSGFEIADRHNLARAQQTKALGLIRVLSEAKVEGVQHWPDQSRPPPPAVVRPQRKTAIQQHHRDSVSARLQNQIRP